MVAIPITVFELTAYETAEPDLAAIASFLKSDAVIIIEVQNWLSDLFNDLGDAPYQALVGKRTKGAGRLKGTDKRGMAELLAEVRGNLSKPLSPRARKWIAEMCDPAGLSIHTVEIQPRLTQRGRRKKRIVAVGTIVLAYQQERNRLGPKERKKAIGRVQDKLGIGVSTIEAALARHEADLEEHGRIIAEECFPLRPNAPPVVKKCPN